MRASVIERVKQIANIAAQASKPARFRVMLKKLYRRVRARRKGRKHEKNKQWIERHCSDFEELALAIDADLWEEAVEVSSALETRAQVKLDEIEPSLGGGGAYPILYFITRHIEPVNIVETGVAAGFSSYSFLAAIKANRKGHLYSSDFPYFRLRDPEQYIGMVVPEDLRDNWSLYVEGDDRNIPKILEQVGEIGLFHYDSDKTYDGRERAVSMIENRLKEDAVVLMDDIQDNSFFSDYVADNEVEKWWIFEFEGKYVGMIGDLKPSG